MKDSKKEKDYNGNRYVYHYYASHKNGGKNIVNDGIIYSKSKMLHMDEYVKLKKDIKFDMDKVGYGKVNIDKIMIESLSYLGELEEGKDG